MLKDLYIFSPFTRAGMWASGQENQRGDMLDADKKSTAEIPSAPAPRETLPDHVYRQLKELILSGDIEPGQSITIQSLATAFEVSHMPVREALKRLTAERALTVVSGRSVGIPPLSRDRLEDLRRVRDEVESIAVQWAAERIEEPALARLDALNDKLDSAVTTGDTKSYLHANREFHFTIYDAAGSPILMSIIEGLWLQISPYFNLLQKSGNYVESNQHHRALADALRKGDPVAARQALQADIATAANSLQQLLG